MKARVEKQWVTWVLLALIVLAGILPFADRAFYMDEHIFLQLARSAQADWMFPSDTPLLFFGTRQADFASHTHPPVGEYYLAVIDLIVGDFSEAPFRLLFAIFPIMAAIGFHGLARRYTKSPLTVTLLFAFSPAFFVMSQTIMMDLPMIAFLLVGTMLYFDHVDGKPNRLAPAALCFILAVGTGYTALVPLGCLFLWALHRRRDTLELVALGAAPIALIFWLAAMTVHFGRFPLTDTVRFVTSQTRSSFENLTATFSFLGGVGVFPFSFLLVTRLERREWYRLVPAAFVVATAMTLPMEWTSLAYRSWFIFLSASGLSMLGAGVVCTFRENGEPRHERVFLLLWSLAVLVFFVLIGDMINARYVLLALPALYLVLFRDVTPARAGGISGLDARSFFGYRDGGLPLRELLSKLGRRNNGSSPGSGIQCLGSCRIRVEVLPGTERHRNPGQGGHDPWGGRPHRSPSRSIPLRAGTGVGAPPGPNGWLGLERSVSVTNVQRRSRRGLPWEQFRPGSIRFLLGAVRSRGFRPVQPAGSRRRRGKPVPGFTCHRSSQRSVSGPTGTGVDVSGAHSARDRSPLRPRRRRLHRNRIRLRQAAKGRKRSDRLVESPHRPEEFPKLGADPKVRFEQPKVTVTLLFGKRSLTAMNKDTQFPGTPDQARSRLASTSSVGLQTFLASDSRLTIPASEKPSLSVILVLFNRAELTLACLRSLWDDYKSDLEIVIVDNASTDETGKLLDRIHGAKIIRNTHNEGFLAASNQGANEARGRNLLFLNNDTEVFPGAISSALHTIESTDDAGAVTGKLIYPDGTLQEAGGIVWNDGSCSGYGRGDDPFDGPYMYRRDVDYGSGAFLLTRRQLFEEMNGFDESFKPAYYEETDYCLRLRERQLRVVFDPDAIILHHEFASSPSTRDAIDLQERHRKIFADKHEQSLTECLVRSDLNIAKARSAIRNESRILFIDDRVPHPSLGSGYPRSRTILTGLLEKGHFVTLYPLAELDESWTSVYQDIPRVVEVMSGMGARRLEEFLESRLGYYETVVVSRPHNMQVMNMVIRAHPEWFRKTVVIYDAEALATHREVSRRELRGEAVSEIEHKTMLENELELSAFADSVIAVSASEKEAFTEHGVNHVFELGHVVRPRPTLREFEERSGFLFVGAIYGDMTSNADAVRWFVEEIFPRISESLGPEVTLSVIGHNESDEIRELASDRVRILGRVDDVTEYYDQGRVFVAPSRFAAGLPHKIHEAAARGIPVVATSLLAEQLGWRDGADCGRRRRGGVC